MGGLRVSAGFGRGCRKSQLETRAGGLILHSSRVVAAILAADCLVYAFCSLGLWQIAEKAGLPFSISEGANSSFVVEAIPPRTPTPIQPGNSILKVDGQRLASLEEVEFLLDGKRVDDAIPLLVESASGVREVNVSLVQAYGPTYLAVAWFVGTLFFVSGVVVIVRKRDDIAALVYHFGAVGVAVIIMCTWGRYTIGQEGTGQAVRAVFSTAYAFVPTLFLHFSLVFPTRRRSPFTESRYLLYVVSGLLSVMMSLMFAKATLPYSEAWFRSFMAVFNVTRWYYAACVVLSVSIFAGSYRSAREEMERRKIRWIVLGLAISSLGFVGLWQIPELLTSRGLVREEVVVLLSGVTPIAFAVAIIRYHVLDIDYLFNRGTVYLVMLVLALSVYAAVVGAVAAVVGGLTVARSATASFVAAVVVAVLFEPTRKKVQQFVDRNFFRVRYDMKAIEARFDEDAERCISTGDLARILVRTIKSTIPVEKVGYFAFGKEPDRLHLVAHEGFDVLESRSVPFDFARLKTDLSKPVAVEGRVEPGAIYEKGDAEVFSRWGAEIVFAARVKGGGVVSLVVMGQKRSGLRYSIEDIELLDYMTRTAGIAHERILLQTSLAFQREENERLEEVNRMKTLFVSSVSHDLKTPLTTIRMYADAIRAGKLSASRTATYLTTIDGEVRRLTRLIDNILDVSKAERGKLAFGMAPERLDDVVREAVRTMEYEVGKGMGKLTAIYRAGSSLVNLNRDAVVEALGNLVANSVEYSRGRPKVQVKTFRRDGCVCVSVTDNGIGIRKEEMDHLLEPFYRGESGRNVRPGGTGLGLSVVKSIMDAHLGTVNLKSDEGLGTEVTLCFPAGDK